MPAYCVYILANRNRRLYIGCTSDLLRRLHQHRTSPHPHFTRRYNVDRLVHVEWTTDAYAAVTRERRLKGWTRARKLALVEEHNPAWCDLSAEWFAPPRSATQRDPSAAARPQDD